MIYECRICGKSFICRYAFAGHHKGHNSQTRQPFLTHVPITKERTSREPHAAPLHDEPPMVAPKFMTDIGHVPSERHLYAPKPLRAYKSLTLCRILNSFEVGAYSPNKRTRTEVVSLKDESKGSSERTLSDPKSKDGAEDRDAVNSKKRKVEIEVDLDLRL